MRFSFIDTSRRFKDVFKRPRFSLKLLLVVFSLVALPLGWVQSTKMYHNYAITELSEKDAAFGRKLRSYPIAPTWLSQWITKAFYLYPLDASDFDNWNIRWNTRKWLCVRGFDNVLLRGPQINKTELAKLRHVIGTKVLGLQDVVLVPADLKVLDDLSQIEYLVFRGKWFADKHVESLLMHGKNLKRAYFYETGISPAAKLQLLEHFGKDDSGHPNCEFEDCMTQESEGIFEREFSID